MVDRVFIDNISGHTVEEKGEIIDFPFIRGYMKWLTYSMNL